MADLTVIPSLQLKETDILTVDKINLMASPLVTLAIETPVTDENFFRNGNFYSSFWTTPAGMSCPIAVETINADYWSVNPNGAAITCKRSTDVPDLYSLWTLELDGAANVTDCSVGQQINGDLSATLRRPCTFSGYIENNSGGLLSPHLEIWTANSFNAFNTVTLQTTVNLQTVAVGTWAYETVTIDLSAKTLTNVANGLFIKVRLPSGALSSTSYRINFSRLKIQLGEVATQFVDDPSLFLQTPSVDSTMLQDGCIARSTLFLPNVIPNGAYQAGSIQSEDIGVGEVEAINLDPGVSTRTAASFVVPAANANVSITVTSATGISAGLTLNIQGAGLYKTVSVSGAVVIAQNTGAAGNAASGTTVPSGNTVTTEGNAVVGCLGYTPVNKAGDTGLGKLEANVDTAVNASSGQNAGLSIQTTSANANNAGYMPCIGFWRPGVIGRALGLDNVTSKFKTVDSNGTVGYLLDTVNKVDTNSYQAGSITLQALAQSLINILIPPGTVRAFAGPSPPAGWLICDGTAYGRVGTYAALFAAIGTYWGAGDNLNTFNVPDLRGRSPLGYVNAAVAGITPRAFGALGGEESHPLSINELANHNHTLSDGTHNHALNQTPHQHYYTNPVGTSIGVQGGASQILYPSGQVLDSASNVTIGIAASGANISIAAAGQSAAHNNMSPFAVMYWLIKY